MGEVPKPSLLVRKLAEVMGEVSHVPKSGHNQTQNYNYATEADVLASVRAGLAKRHVVLTPRVEKLDWRQIQREAGKAPLNVATVHMTFCAHDGETGEVLEVASTVGEGMDSGDKAVFKAMTGATKYAVLKLFLIPTGDDPEADGKPEPRQRQQRSESRPAANSPANGTGPTTFPNFGKAKGQPIQGASMGNLELYANAARRTLADPEKSQYHAKERLLLAAYEAEMATQRVAAAGKDRPPAVGDGESEEEAKKRAAAWPAAKDETPQETADRVSGSNYKEALALGAKLKWTDKETGTKLKELFSVTKASHVNRDALKWLRAKAEQAAANPARSSPPPVDPDPTLAMPEVDPKEDAPF